MIPRIRFAHLPTPIESYPRLGAALGGLRLLVKRDDLTGLALGGNKTRKLEFVLAAALAAGAKTLVTTGAVQSNHCRQTAAVAARYGLDCILVVSGIKPDIASGNLLLDDLLGAEIVYTSSTERAAKLDQVFQQAWEQGRRPYLIPLGASNEIGSAGYYDAFAELIEQLGSDRVDWVVVASSSGGTQAGLALGTKAFSFEGRLLGISIDRHESELREIVHRLANGTAEHLNLEIGLQPDEILINDDYLGKGYGVMGDLEREAIRLFASHAGLLLDPVYTGRAAGAMIDLARKGFFKAGETVLFWHTGGSPALFASQYQDSLSGTSE